MALTIAIDGPVGAGKSSVAKQLADALGILHLDTGAMYRALGFKALREGVDPLDVAASEALCGRTDIAVRLEAGLQRTFLDGMDITDQIRTPQVSAAASAISKARGVRRHMVALQQQYALQSDMVLDGRDIGTCVLPNATFKFFLTAPSQVRARRRYEELRAKEIPCAYEEVLRDLIARDEQDAGREVSPLKRAEDALEIDTADLTEEGVLEMLLGIVKGDGAK